MGNWTVTVNTRDNLGNVNPYSWHFFTTAGAGYVLDQTPKDATVMES